MKIKLTFPIIVLLYFICGCNSANIKSRSEIIQSDQLANKSINSHTNNSTDPVNIHGEFPANLRTKWKEFTADGKYRLANSSDMTFSEEVKMQLSGNGKSSIVPYVYIWGDLGYQKRIEDDHFAVIVVDTTRNTTDKFSLVIFSPTKNTKDDYEINWLYQNRDLSKTTVNGASGEFYVSQYADYNSRRACSVKWNPNLKKFNCG